MLLDPYRVKARGMFRMVGVIGLAMALTSCGGAGGSSGSDAVCADFRYQEDAQAAFRSGATQLDRDKDGIACEDLPKRPVSTNPPTPTAPSTPGVTYTQIDSQMDGAK